jgi:hypothetical protein
MASQFDPRQAQRLLQRKVYVQLLSGIGIIAIPISVWWYWSYQERTRTLEEYRTRVKLPPGAAGDTYDYMITEKIQAGDVLLFDRRCERCAASPWAALACIISKQCLTSGKNGNDALIRSVDAGRYDHVGLVVPGYVRTRADAFDPTNLLLLEATASGIVARPLKERLELSASHSVLLLQLASPGEQRNRIVGGDEETSSSQQILVARTRAHVERELKRFRDTWVPLGAQYHYQYLHSTLTLGGALAYGLGLYRQSLVPMQGPVSASAYLVLCGLQQAAAAPSITDVENRRIQPEDFLRDYRLTEEHAVRLRPGWRFLAPITLKQSSSSSQ